MLFKSDTYFNPSNNYRTKWSLCPQDLSLNVAGHKTRAFLSSISSFIYLFHLLSIIAIILDIYLGFKVLKKAGVGMGVITASVALDYVLAVIVYLFSFFGVKKVQIENQLFTDSLKSMSLINGESTEQYNVRRSGLMDKNIKSGKTSLFWIRFLKILSIIAICGIAYWKIYTYSNTLPPGMIIWKMATGKLVLIFAILCALFHIIATENSFAHLYFKIVYSGEYNSHLKNMSMVKPTPEEREIIYIGNYNEATSGNTSIVKKSDKVYLTFINVIRDEEILSLLNAQTDNDAKKGVAIVAKENQVI